MKLSEEQLQQAISALGCVQESSIKSNPTNIRVPTGTRAAIIPCGESRELKTVVVLNLTKTGIGILNGSPMRSGDNFILRLAAANNLPATAILCTVFHTQRTPAGQYAVGTQFTRILTVRNEQIADPQSATGRLDDQGLAHLREVEQKLSQWCV